MRTAILRMLAGKPALYLRVLRMLGRGSLEKRIYLALIRRGDVVFDIGANRGYFTRLFSDIAGAGGRVHAFEPVPGTFAMLERAMNDACGFANFTLNNSALGETDGTVTIHLPGNDDGQASARVHRSGSWAGTAEVHSQDCRVNKLDTYAANIQRLDFIKCDVEGAELSVVKGGWKTLERLSPMLFAEVNPEWTNAFGYIPDDLVSSLRETGYDTFFLADEKLSPLADAKISGSANLLCAKSKIHSRRLAALERI